ncbi:MAG: hypothetical protein ACOC1O_00070 [bacterium]
MIEYSLDEIERNLVLACKGHYNYHIPALKKIYEHFYIPENNTDEYVLNKIFYLLLKIIFKYDILNNVDEIIRLIMDIKTSKKNFLFNENLPEQELHLLKLINVISNWQVNGRYDKKVFFLGEPDAKFYA